MRIVDVPQEEGRRISKRIPIELYIEPVSDRAVTKVAPSVVSIVIYPGSKVEYQSSGIIFEACNSGNHIGYYVVTSIESLKRPRGDGINATAGPSAGLDDPIDGQKTPTETPLSGEKKKSNSPDSVLPAKSVAVEQDVGSSSHATDEICVYLSSGEMCVGKIFAWDDYYNIAVLKIEPANQSPTACLTPVDDNVASIFCRPVDGRDSLKLAPGDAVIAVGRHYQDPHGIIATRGEYSVDHFNLQHACKDFLLADIKIKNCCIGGPLISFKGEVIGINFFDPKITPFLPMNIFLKWWEYFKVNQNYRRPWVGVEACSLFAAPPCVWESIQDLEIFHGVVIKKVLPGSPAEDAGIHPLDVIVKCAGMNVMSILEFLEILWGNAGKELAIEVIQNGILSEMKIEVEDYIKYKGCIQDVTSNNKGKESRQNEFIEGIDVL